MEPTGPYKLSDRMALSEPFQSSFPICSERLPGTGYGMEKGWLQDLEPVRYAAETGAGVTLGDEVELRHGDVAVDGDAALFKRGGNWLKAMDWRSEEVPDQVEALQSRQRREVPDRTSSLHRSDTPRQDDTGNRGRPTAAGSQDDARTLWIDWDGQGERYKP